MTTEEDDIEMGENGFNTDQEENSRKTESGKYLCCSEVEIEKDDASSSATSRDHKTNNRCSLDEDDLGDNADELHQAGIYFDKQDYGVDYNNNILFEQQYSDKQETNIACFDMNREFFKIIDKAGGGRDDTRQSEYNYEEEQKSLNGDFNIPSMFSDRNFNKESFDDSAISRLPAVDSDIAILHNIEEFWEANSESEDEDYLDKTAKHSLDQISFEKLKKKVYKDFEVTLIHRYSSALDILASYIKYHVIIYSEASYYCNFKLNLFMVPAILFSTVCSVITGVTHNRDNMAIIVSSLNGFIAFLLAIINYLKLDASAEAHKISAYQYSKLKNYIEFSSGEILLFQDPVITNKNFISEQIKMWQNNNEGNYSDTNTYKNERNKKLKQYHRYKSHLEKKLIDTIQNKIFEIKKSLKNIEDNNNFILPKHINRRYYNIYNINVFSYIKSVENYKLILLNHLRNVKNEIRFYRTMENTKMTQEIVERIKKLYKRKNSILTEFLELNKGFMLIDAMFQQEIKNINIRKKYWIIFKFQGFIKMIVKCFCCEETQLDILPSGYRHCTHVGFIDEEGRYLLDKVLRFNNVLNLVE
uniref:Uncharacterized protein n=1 Tax=viral metagenome TaxID=1070528 RepID=A0A6C0KYD5_9ZZZZ